MMLFAYVPAGMAEEVSLSNNADLSGLTVAGAVYYNLAPAFDAATTGYTVDIPNEVSSVDIIATTADTNATLTIGGTTAASGVAQEVGGLVMGANNIDVAVTAQDGTTVKTYTITINRAAAEGTPLPQTPAEYAASDYAKYGSRMAAGYAHLAVINANGAIEVGGDNTYGQCGMPDGLKGVKVKAVAAGSYHTLALTEDGRVFAWGSASGNGAIEHVSIPAEVTAVQGNIKLIAAGSQVSAVVTNSNQVIVWGVDEWNLQNVPAGLGNIAAMTIGYNCAVVLNDEGNVTVWGNSACTTIPDGLNGNVVAIEAGMNHWLALKKDGTVSVTGASAMTNVCKKIANQTDVRAIAGGWQFAGAILADGSVKGWGRTMFGTKKDGIELIPASANITAFVCANDQGVGNASAVCAMQGDGTIKIEAPGEFVTAPITDKFNFLTVPGNNADLSSLEVAGYTLSPAFDAAITDYTVNVPNEVSSVEITATTADANATLTIGGTAAVSGVAQTVSGLVGANNINVQVISADGNTSKTYTITVTRTGEGDLPQTPEAYAASSYAKYNARIAGGEKHAAAVLKEGTLEVWGDNTYGQLEIVPQATGVKALAAGQSYTIALKEDGTVEAWGSNTKGQCNAPAELAGKEVKSIAANGFTSAALTQDNQIYIWGQYNGVLVSANKLVKIALNNTYLLALAADGTVEAWKCKDLSSFAAPEGFSGDVIDIKAGATKQALALKKDGSVAGWNEAYLPAGLTGVLAVAAGNNFSAAICQNGTVTVWGVDDSGYGYLNVPSGLQKAEALATGYYDIYVLQEDGAVVSWGRNHYGQGDVPEGLNLYSEVSANDRLIDLAVKSSDGTDSPIYPIFNCEQTTGVAEVAHDTAQALITAQAYSSTATLTINGDTANSGEAYEAALNFGDNPMEIIVTAASGRQRSYTLHVKRYSAGDALTPLPQTPEAYQNSDYAVYSRRLGSGDESVLAVKNNGTVAAWGLGQNGRNVNIPPDAVDVIAVAAGSNHSLALKKDGTVIAWGFNDYGQSDVPEGLSGVVDICVVGANSIVLDKNGKLTAWGYNLYGECNIPENLSGVVDIQGGARHVLALKSDGTVAAWGANDLNQSDVPAGLDHVVAVAAGYRQNVALKDDGTIVIWGAEGTKYAIGNPNLGFIKGVAAGNDYVAVLKMDGRVVSWDKDMKLVYGIPVEQDKKALAISGNGDITQLLCLNEDGTVDVWTDDYKFGVADIPSGLNLFEDQAPYNGPAPDIPQTPAAYAASNYVQAKAKICYTDAGWAILNMDGAVKFIKSSDSDNYNLAQIPEGLNNVKAIGSSAFYNIMALQEDGRVVVWGLDDDGQCQVPETAQDITAIWSTKNMNNCCLALKKDGSLIAWGNNSYGQRYVPEGLHDVIDITAGYDHFVSLNADGTIVAWGKNDFGQCDVPEGLNNVARIFADYNYSLALKNDGTVVAWGSNYDAGGLVYTGQCDVPEGLSGVVDISLEGNTCIALKNNGTAIVWGENIYGKRNVPPDLHDVAAVSIGAGGAIAAKIDGAVICWGHINAFDEEIFTSLSNVLTMSNDNIIIFRDGTLQYYDLTPDDNDTINAVLNGLNVLSGHYFNIASVELLDPAGNSINTVPSQGGYRIQVGIDNNYASSTNGLTIIQVRGGSGATSDGGGRVLGCVGISSLIPVTGSTVSSDFTMSAGISGPAYVDVFVWDGWDTMVPRAEASQDLSFDVTQ